MMKKTSPQNRRGLATIVGAMYFTILMIGTFSVLSLALDAQIDIVETQKIVFDSGLKKQQEQFDVSFEVDADDILILDITNQGQNVLEISSIWMINEVSSEPPERFAINYEDSFILAGQSGNILKNEEIFLIPGTYEIKIISSLGTIKRVFLTVEP